MKNLHQKSELISPEMIFKLEELENYRGKFSLGIERDVYFDEKRISEVIPKAKS